MEGGRPHTHQHHHQHHHHPASMPPVQYAHVTPTSTHDGAVEHFRWGGVGPEGGAGGSGAQCSISCNREGLVMTYSALPGSPVPVPAPAPAPASCSLCTALAAPHTCPFSQFPGGNAVTEAATEQIASRTQEAAAGRSSTFCGSLDRTTPRTAPQRPYGRRCKSTAHIVLQNTDQQQQETPRPHEFHATPTSDPAPAQTPTRTPATPRPQQEPRGRARTRTAATPLPDRAGGMCGPGGNNEGVVGWGGGPSCTCHHCSTLYSLMTSLTCPCHHHQHHPHHPHPAHRPTTRSPTIRTFDSHTTYDIPPVPPAPAPSSPRPPRRCSPPSPCGSPPPEKPRLHTSPHAQRRVPRMGAAAATAAAAAAAGQV
ncbi:hypothetical protein Pcinc_043151 [Petrolisthes cinctipes]|uniref:Uncharacterized protein n=1 Tax=Petrolisthes cinctipes TaxID=88211 RepID=A0AAE1EFA1_PETCI|nr:hypothetical protein Pcinc_043151 [Petrolisthes cinctipes]